MKSKPFIIFSILFLFLLFTECREWNNPYDELKKIDTTDTTTNDIPTSVTDYDGNTYEVVKIGEQIWMAENLKTFHYVDGTDVTLWGYGAMWGNNDYGPLYSWSAASNGISSEVNPSGVQGICPDGWHLPSDAEWTDLTDYLGGTNVAGGKMKETGTFYWSSPNTGATNESGFSALPAGIVISGTEYDFGNKGYWWSATQSSGSDAWCSGLNYDTTEVYRLNRSKLFALSIRCLKNSD